MSRSLLFSGLKVARLLKMGLSSLSCSAAFWLDGGNLDRGRKRRDGGRGCGLDEEMEETVELESTESRESGCLRSVRLLFPWGFFGRVAANVGPFSEGQRSIMWSRIHLKKNQTNKNKPQPITLELFVCVYVCSLLRI